MTPEERAELDALRERVAEVNEACKHLSGLAIVQYNGLLQLSTLTLDLVKSTTPAAPHVMSPEERMAMVPQIQAGLEEMRNIFNDLFARLEPMRVFLSEAK